mgnify:CR=1 FL=1
MSEQKLSERMNTEIKELILQGLPVTQSQALDWRDEVAALEAKLEAVERASQGLLHVLPDSLFHTRIENDDSWGWCWNELSGNAQDHVKAAREAWADAQQEKEE